MKEHFFKRAFNTVGEAFQNCLKRFPITVCFVLALCVFLCYLVSAKTEGLDKQSAVLLYYFSIGTLLSLSLHLWSEEVKNRIRKVLVHVAAHALLIADAIFLYNLSPERSYTEIGIAHGAGILALGISVFFLSFTKEKNDIPSWNFTSYTIGSFATTNVIGLIMSGGISLLVFSLHMLFGVNVDYKCYLYILIICSVLLPALLFLGLLPKDAGKHNWQPHSSSFLSGVIHFLFLPLIAGYLVVLYIYTARILISWELPIGWVSWLVVALMTGCIAIEFGLYPVRIQEAKRTDEWIARWLPALVLPLLLLMTVGIIRRFNDYGVTINRLYLITLNIWFYIVCAGLFFTKARRIYWISVSFSLIFLLTSVLPVNYASITRNTLRSDVEEEMKLTCKAEPPLTYDEYNNWLDSLPEETALQINEKFMYLENWFGPKSVDDLVRNVSFYNAKYRYKTDVDTIESAERTTSYNGHTNPLNPIKLPDGYEQFIPISDISINDKDISIPYKETGVVPVFLHTQTGNRNDTVYVDLKTLEELNSNKYGEMQPVLLKCNSSKSLFMLTSFHLTYYARKDKDIRLSIDGYLFKK